MENQIRFYGRGSEFFGIWIVNLLLSIVTLGVYSAWAKVRTKKYFYGNTDLAGDRFDYHAKPIQILKGRIVAAVCVAVWLISNSFFPLFSLVLFLAFALALPWLVRGNTRFDARVTSYRNVRFDFAGTLKGAYGVFLGWPALCYLLIGLCFFFTFSVAGSYPVAGVLLGILTFALGFVLYAWIAAQMATYFINGYRYGDRAFSGDVELSVYIKTYFLGGLLGIGLSVVWVIIGATLGGVSMLSELGSTGQMAGPGASLGMIVVIAASYASMILTMLVVMGFIKARIRNYLFGQALIDGEPEYRLSSQMSTWGLVSLMVTNFLLTVVTLGFARPWVKVRTARYVADTTMVIGDLDKLVVQGSDTGTDSAITDEVSNALDLNIGIG
ncbi:YjgN family protein [Photobacterium lutimaris]|uniref:DUF898 domain-containing protein n=1 Tax=Photobacterium lutimaris TaxID=388278 RepID=A0A2T3IRH0_9GAMM|nr:YjgN family protein [Photobacterium lutimaris]PSU30935.1 DUF898 domain-containing protein [Photobacterium lutimaris]TDR72170.1 uncharacterized membrane protein YjgN (DUF898 family) [Photobacterium lutimaris]